MLFIFVGRLQGSVSVTQSRSGPLSENMLLSLKRFKWRQQCHHESCHHNQEALTVYELIGRLKMLTDVGKTTNFEVSILKHKGACRNWIRMQSVNVSRHAMCLAPRMCSLLALLDYGFF